MALCPRILCVSLLLWHAVAVLRPTSTVRNASPFDAFLNADPTSTEEERRFIKQAQFAMSRSRHFREEPQTKALNDVGKTFKHKWIFVRGDSTMRMVVAALFGSVLQMDEEKLKDFARYSDKCTRPPHSPDYKSFLERHPEFGDYSCYVNEKICNFHLQQFNLTYDWQHLIMESRERYLFDPSAAQQDQNHDFHHGLPDALVIGLPIHPCVHTNKKGSAKFPSDQPDLEKNYTSQIKELVTAVRNVFHGPVFWMEAGGYTKFASRQQYHACLDSMNTELARVTTSDENSYLVKRADIEKQWVRDHFAQATDVHKPPECNHQVGERLINAMTQAKFIF